MSARRSGHLSASVTSETSPVRSSIPRTIDDCNACRYQFGVTAGTIIRDSHLPLRQVVIAIHLMRESKRDLSVALSALVALGAARMRERTGWCECRVPPGAGSGGRVVQILTLRIVLDRAAETASIAARGEGDVEITGDVRLLAVALDDVATTLRHAHIQSTADATVRDLDEREPDPDSYREHETERDLTRALVRFMSGAAARARSEHAGPRPQEDSP